MTTLRPPSNQHIRLFENRFFEFFTVFSLGGFVAAWLVLMTALAAFAILYVPASNVAILMLLGWVVWTFVEYALHRFVFHLQPRSERLRQLIFLIHGNHHANPNDPLRNLMPPIVSVPLASLIWGIFVLALGAEGTWLFLGFMLGYVLYDLVHYCCHQFPMKGALGRRLKLHHMQHHFHREGGNYAITGMIWDRMLSTRISRSKTEV